MRCLARDDHVDAVIFNKRERLGVRFAELHVRILGGGGGGLGLLDHPRRGVGADDAFEVLGQVAGDEAMAASEIDEEVVRAFVEA